MAKKNIRKIFGVHANSPLLPHYISLFAADTHV